MKKKLLAIILTICFVILGMFVLSACGDESTDPGTQPPAEAPSDDQTSGGAGDTTTPGTGDTTTPGTGDGSDVTEHTHAYAESVTENATCTKDGLKTLTCSCGDTKTEAIPATGHSYENKNNKTHHWTECSCGDKTIEEAHTYENGLCSVCGREEGSQGLAYTLSEDESFYIVSGIGTATDTEVVIPAVYNGKPVSAIGDSAFSSCTTLTSISIPESVISIGEAAFSECKGLVNIVIPEGVTEVKVNVFLGCTSLENVTIPDSVTSIGNSAFSGCTELKNVTIPEKVTNIGESAFKDCTSLVSIAIPEGVTVIRIYLFFGCTSLTSVIIPDTVTSIGASAFSGCENLTDLTFEGTENAWNSVEKGEGWNTGIGEYNLSTAPEPSDGLGYTLNSDGESYSVSSIGDCTDKNIVIPKVYDGKPVTAIADSAFWCKSTITSITIPKSVVAIGKYAFYNCTSLISVSLPSTLTSIGANAYDSCTKLKSITIPSGVEVIEEYAFYNCTSLMYLTICDGVKVIGDSAFDYCTKLSSVVIPGSVISIGYTAFYGCVSLTSISIPDSVISIGEGAFTKCNKLEYNTYGNAYYLGNEINPYAVLIKAIDTSIVRCEAHKDTKIVYAFAFSGCASLTEVSLPSGVCEIGNNAFDGCSALLGIVIPDGVSSVGTYAFRGCTTLSSIEVPDSIIKIGYCAFVGCDSMTYNTYNNGMYLGNETNPYVVLMKVIDTSKETFEIHNDTKVIYDEVFSTCTAITEITLPDGVRSMGYWAFSGCPTLASITIPKSVILISAYMIANSTTLTSINYEGTMEEWYALDKVSDWDINTLSYIVHCKDGDII